jgi:hypothetical protein
MYSIDLAYLEYFKCVVKGKYSTNFVSERVTAFLLAMCLSFFGLIRIISRIANVMTEVVKVVFYLIGIMFESSNTPRFFSHVKLMILGIIALVGHSSQVFIHLLSIIIAVVYPSLSYRMMRETFNFLVVLSTLEDKISQDYKTPVVYIKLLSIVKLKLTSIFDNCSWPVKISMNTLINEFSHAFDAGLVAPLGFMERFKLFGANPEVISDSEQHLDPILLLNGNYSHQATFLPLLYKLKKSGNNRPIYTVNLPPNCDDINLIIKKVNEIKEQYSRPINIDVVGHSMGAFLIQKLIQAKSTFFVNRVITLGTPCFIEHLFSDEKVFDITAKDDLIISCKSQLKHPENIVEVTTGHLGLLFHKKSLQAIQQFLQT